MNLNLVGMHETYKGKMFSGKRASQQLSNNFKSISREKDPAWGNRFIKDHYDLIYDADPYSIGKRFGKKKAKIHQLKQNQTIQSPIKKYQYSPFKSRQMPKTSQTHRSKTPVINPQHYKTNFIQYEKGLRNGQQTAASTDKKERYVLSSRKIKFQQLAEAQNAQKEQINMDSHPQNKADDNPLSKVNLMGVSPFQFQNTIKGKIMTKSNHHLDFSKNKTQKINNIIHKYYDYSKDIQKDEALLQREKHKVTQKIHSFKSYSAHKLFHRDRRFDHDNGCGHGGQLDQYYQISRPEIYDFNHEITNKNSVDYRKMTPRPDLRKKLGTNLQYNDIHSHKTLALLDHKKPILTMSKSQRRLVIGRQVISPSRGCYR